MPTWRRVDITLHQCKPQHRAGVARLRVGLSQQVGRDLGAAATDPLGRREEASAEIPSGAFTAWSHIHFNMLVGGNAKSRIVRTTPPPSAAAEYQPAPWPPPPPSEKKPCGGAGDDSRSGPQPWQPLGKRMGEASRFFDPKARHTPATVSCPSHCSRNAAGEGMRFTVTSAGTGDASQYRAEQSVRRFHNPPPVYRSTNISPVPASRRALPGSGNCRHHRLQATRDGARRS